jgi:hypothetical protein
VRAGNQSGYSDWSSPVIVMMNSPLSTTPQNITYYQESNEITTIIWDKVANINDYRIEINGIISEDVLNESKASITTIPGEQYSIRIASVVQSGEEVQLDWSDEVTFRASDRVPEVPEVEKMTATSDAITVSWQEVAGAYGYEIDMDGQRIDVDNHLSYVITSLEPSSTHTIKVRAYNESGAGNWSLGKTIMTNEGIPGVPINITGGPIANVSTATGSAIKIQWDAVEGVSSYEVKASDGIIHQSIMNEIVIDNLIPGVKYDFQVRALTNTEAGAWSNKISFVAEVTAPSNVSIEMVNGVIRLFWDKVGGAEFYEVELNGLTYTTTNKTSLDLDRSIFFMERVIRVRACYGTQKSEWSKEIIFNQALPVTIDVNEGEEISVLLPVKNANISKYKLTIMYDPDELELLDALEITQSRELSSTYIEELNTHIVITQKDGIKIITFLVEKDEVTNWSGIASSIRFKSKKTGSVTIRYGVDLK